MFEVNEETADSVFADDDKLKMAINHEIFCRP